jgi:hypothetical protein
MGGGTEVWAREEVVEARFRGLTEGAVTVVVSLSPERRDFRPVVGEEFGDPLGEDPWRSFRV